MIKIYRDLEQGSPEWLEARRGLLTASEMKKVITPKMKPANNPETRRHVYELAAQRISGFVEPAYVSDDMLRGMTDEGTALNLYNEHYAPLERVGFITNNAWGFTLGYSPDALVGDDGLVEIKSRGQKYQVQTIVSGIVPSEYVIQCQTGLLVSEREWLDFISFSAGLPMFVCRVWPDERMQEAILEASAITEALIIETMEAYTACVKARNFIETERNVEQEMHL